MNVLHHFFDPIHAIHMMMKMARSRIVLEVAVPTWRDVVRKEINPSGLLGFGAPAIFLGRPKKKYGDIAGRTFLFTPQALKIIFNMHTSMFEPIDVVQSPFKDRMVVTAQKRRIGHLVVVTGPTSAGKSTLSARLAGDPEFRRQFGMDAGDWPIVNAPEAFELPPRRHDRLILHYDFLKPSRTGIRSYDRDPTLHLMNVAEKVTVLTIATPRKRLIEQLRTSEIEQVRKPQRKHLELLNLYGKQQFLVDWYTAWELFCSRFPSSERVLIENCGEFKRATGKGWEEILEA